MLKIFCLFSTFAVVYSLLGGLQSHPKLASEASDKFQQALQSVIKFEFAEKAGFQPKKFDLISYKTQIVAGTNYFAKVEIDDGKYAHLRIFEPLPYTKRPMQLHSYQLEKGLGDEIDYF